MIMQLGGNTGMSGAMSTVHVATSGILPLRRALRSYTADGTASCVAEAMQICGVRATWACRFRQEAEAGSITSPGMMRLRCVTTNTAYFQVLMCTASSISTTAFGWLLLLRSCRAQ